MNSRKERIENLLGFTVTDAELVEATAQAKRKLGRIIEQEGDADGARRRPEYLDRLTAEIARVNKLNTITTKVLRTCAILEQVEYA